MSLCLAIVAGCDRAEPDDGRARVSFLCSGNRAQRDAYEQSIAAFEAANPDIDVDLQWNTSGPFFARLLTMMAGGMSPDVMFMYEFKLPYFAAKRTLADLTPYIARDMRDEDRADFHPSAFDIFSYRDRIYAMPVTFAPVVLLYNKTLFAEAGVAPPDDNWTWADFRDAAQRLTVRDGDDVMQWGVTALDKRLFYIAVTGVRLLGDDLDELNHEHPQMIEVMRFWSDLIHEDGVCPGIEARARFKGQDLFLAGSAAMTITGRWMTPVYNTRDDLDYDAALIPKWRNGHRGSYTHAVGYAMSSACENKEAAWRFIRWLGSRENLELLTALGDTVPTRLSVARSDLFLNPDVKPARDEVFLRSLDHAHYIQVTDPALPEFLNEQIELFIYGEKSLARAMADTRKRVRAFIDLNDVELLR